MPVQAPYGAIEVAIEPKSKEAQRRLGVALAALCEEDSSLVAYVDRESGQTILKGQSEVYLDEVIEALKTTYGVEINIGAPQVAYRETLGQPAEIDHTYSRLEGSSGVFARVSLLFEPGEPNSGELAETRGDAAPLAFVNAVLAGIAGAAQDGLIAGFPVIDFKVTVLAVVWHDIDSTAVAFEIASRAAFRELRERGAPKLLEPIMKVEVVTPDKYMGDVIGDLNSRRGQIQGTETRGNAQVVTAFVPLANIFGYINTLRSFSQGRANFSMTYDHYAAVLRPELDPDPDFGPAIGMRLRA